MNNFFNLSDGSSLGSNTSFTNGTSFEPIPAGTIVKTAINSCQWVDVPEQACQQFGLASKAIQLELEVSEGQFTSRRIWQTLHVIAPDAKKSDRAKRMFAVIDSVTGSGIIQSGRVPTNPDLARMHGKIITVKVGLYQGNNKSKNYIEEIGVHLSQSKQVQQAQAQPPQQQYPNQQQQYNNQQQSGFNPMNVGAPHVNNFVDDDIPF